MIVEVDAKDVSESEYAKLEDVVLTINPIDERIERVNRVPVLKIEPTHRINDYWGWDYILKARTYDTTWLIFTDRNCGFTTGVIVKSDQEYDEIVKRLIKR